MKCQRYRFFTITKRRIFHNVKFINLDADRTENKGPRKHQADVYCKSIVETNCAVFPLPTQSIEFYLYLPILINKYIRLSVDKYFMSLCNAFSLKGRSLGYKGERGELITI